MVAPAVEGIDLFKIAGRSISGWIPSFKTGTDSHVRQPSVPVSRQTQNECPRDWRAVGHA
jgi:hypothetical protein